MEDEVGRDASTPEVHAYSEELFPSRTLHGQPIKASFTNMGPMAGFLRWGCFWWFLCFWCFEEEEGLLFLLFLSPLSSLSSLFSRVVAPGTPPSTPSNVVIGTAPTGLLGRDDLVVPELVA